MDESELLALRHQRDVLARERDELKAHAERLQRENTELSVFCEDLKENQKLVWAPPGHFYSPIVDPCDRFVRRILSIQYDRGDDPCRGVLLDAPRMRELIRSVVSLGHDLRFPRDRTDEFRYYFGNPNFEFVDAFFLGCFMRHYRPRRIVEIGSGFSSCVIMDVNDRFFDGRIDVRFHDPYPQTLLNLLKADDPYLARISAEHVQDIPANVFEALEAGDILFIDSSHISKMGSDVNDILFRILPVLNPGVLVHFHDIGYPFEYPAAWVDEENRSWNEAYLLRAFLSYNHKFKVLFWSDFVLSTKLASGIAEEIFEGNCGGGSLWLTVCQ